ncbi:MAG: DUF5615 family PIN-like protein [Candidatus Omnitrophica bacterium]|nr:DUF5615 family PIN-like protein [Candidatus Omnitrophota bacterium]
MEKVKIYLDEDIRPLLAEVLRIRGYDVMSCIEKRLFGLSDEAQLRMAIKEKRAILTHNIKDFAKLHKKLKGAHFGIILSNQTSFSLLLRRLLKFLAAASLEKVKGRLIWISDYK